MTFTDTWLRKQGIHEPLSELQKLSEILEAEFEMRVGGVVASHLTDQQLQEFEDIMRQTADADADDVRIAWLDQAYPDYPKIVHAQKAKLSRQVRAAQDKAGFIRRLQGSL